MTKHTPEFLAHYPMRFNMWAGNSAGRAPDYGKCCESVWSNHLSYQCARKNGHGPDGAYCKQHDPVARNRRAEVSAYRSNLASYERRMRSHGPMVAIIQAVADGHNDPRQLCTNWLEENAAMLPVKPKKPDHMEED